MRLESETSCRPSRRITSLSGILRTIKNGVIVALISVQEMSKQFGAEPLFDGLNFSIESGAKLGLVGPNGAGKSTLMKILVGFEQADSGSVSRQRGLKTLWIDQDSNVPDGITARDFLMGYASAAAIPVEQRTGAVASALGKANILDPEALASSLSGGQKKKLHLARLFVEEPDLAFLDEPTNHLDLEAVLWLESVLRDAPFAWVLISHDRYFLDRTVRTIVELSGIYPTYYMRTDGNYSAHIEKRTLWLESQISESQSLANKLRRENEWLARGAKARTTKQQARIDEAFNIAKEHAELSKRLAKRTQADLEFHSSGRKTKKLIELKSVRIQRADSILVEDLSLVITSGSRIGIMGKNGSGKSSLLKTIAKELAPLTGQVNWAQDLSVVYFDQHREALDPQWSLRRALGDGGDAVVFQSRSIHIVSWARRFQFNAGQLDTPVKQLSGGERARVLIARLMLKAADVLILDEPTNDLDIETLEVLEQSLQDFSGAVIVVSHDRQLISKVSEMFVGINGYGATSITASYDQWEREFMKGKSPGKHFALSPSKGEKKAKKLSYKEQLELEQCEKQIVSLEEAILNLENDLEMSSLSSNTEETLRFYTQLNEKRNLLESTYSRWSELEEKKALLEASPESYP